jgi:hypothetical protein
METRLHFELELPLLKAGRGGRLDDEPPEARPDWGWCLK